MQSQKGKAASIPRDSRSPRDTGAYLGRKEVEQRKPREGKVPIDTEAYQKVPRDSRSPRGSEINPEIPKHSKRNQSIPKHTEGKQEMPRRDRSVLKRHRAIGALRIPGMQSAEKNDRNTVFAIVTQSGHNTERMGLYSGIFA